jgi:hypothetical protein
MMIKCHNNHHCRDQTPTEFAYYMYMKININVKNKRTENFEKVIPILLIEALQSHYIKLPCEMIINF